MTQNMLADKGSADLAQAATFLAALYTDVGAGLWVEFRLIHPLGAPIRQLWLPTHRLANAAPILAQAARLNSAGYGVYFAPCLRSRQEGTASAAALMPALWAELDRLPGTCNDETLRKRLETFPQPPSVLVASGGGLHAYWFLSTPLVLAEASDRSYAARLLNGLSSGVGADRAYVKSVATPMRLPGFSNTKPVRRGVQVLLLAFETTRRYPAASFHWLLNQDNTHTRSQPQAARVSEGLSRSTYTYLSYGTAHNRNNRLFRAACDLRAHGYSQADARRLLVGRYLADARPGESLEAREREALRTIASAYTQG